MEGGWTDGRVGVSLRSHRRQGGGEERERSRGGEHRDPSLTKKLFATDTCQERGNLSSPIECHHVHELQTRAGPIPRSIKPTQIWTPYFLYTFCFDYVFFCLLGLFVF